MTLSTSTQKFQRPFMKWAGGKFKILEKILPLLPMKRRLVEPFIGSGVVSLNTNYSAYWFSDQNADLINFYQHLFTEGQTFIDACERLFQSETNTLSFYLDRRQEFNECAHILRKSILLLYLNRHGYNGLCRYNQKGKYNVPFGRYLHPYFPKKELQAFYQKSQESPIKVSNFSFEDCLQHVTTDDVVYCDPPYVPISETAYFNQYTSQGFDMEKQKTLAKFAIELAEKNIPVLISNHDNAFTRETYKDAVIHSFPVKRYISCHPHNRKTVNELIAVFY